MEDNGYANFLSCFFFGGGGWVNKAQYSEVYEKMVIIIFIFWVIVYQTWAEISLRIHNLSTVV